MTTADPGDRFARQRTLLADGQASLEQSSVLVIGCGGLGAGAIPPLVASGVGTVTLLDDDVVEASNLNRQTLFTTADLGGSKAELAAARMRALNPGATVTARRHRLTADDVELVAGHDLVLDCTDRAASRSAISAACRVAGTPWVWAAIDGWTAVISVFTPGHTQYEDVVPNPTESPVPLQILGALPSMAGAWQAAEAVKVLTGQGRPLVDRLAVVDLLTADVRFVDLARPS